MIGIREIITAVSPASNPQGPASGDYKLVHGGGWGNDDQNLRLTYRGASAPHASLEHCWFSLRGPFWKRDAARHVQQGLSCQRRRQPAYQFDPRLGRQ